MSTELLLILIVALLVFGPNKLPMLATHLGFLLRKVNQWKNQAALLWEQQLKELQLEENKRKAAEAEQQYERLNKTIGEKEPSTSNIKQ